MSASPPDTTAFGGSMTALVTPFLDGEVDWARLDALIDRQLEAGTDWLVPCGTTGESPTLTAEERERIIATAIQRSRGRCRVMAGTGTNSTQATVEATRRAAQAGADAALVVAPYYNRPTAEGLYRHYAALAESVELPLVLYNVPARTGVTISNDVIVRLREAFPHVVAVKDATGTVAAVTDLRTRCDIAVLSGDDPLTWPMMAVGAVGVISVIGNLVPELVKSQVDAGLARNFAAAEGFHRKVYDLATGIGRYGPNPLPIKTAMARCDLLCEAFRLPLCPVDAQARAGVELVLRRHELLHQKTS